MIASGCITRISDVKPKSAGELTAFRLERSQNPTIDKDVVFRIYGNHNITAYATSNYDLKSLKPSFDIEGGKLLVGDVVQQSGATANNFSDKITYTFLSDRGQTTTYTVHLVPYTGLPVVTISTTGEKEVLNKENWLPAQMTVEGMGRFPDSSDSLYVRGRGAEWLDLFLAGL